MSLTRDSKRVLNSGAIGAISLAGLGAVMMAPALGIYANLGPVSANAGNIAPAVFLAALVCTLPTAISYALISREIPSAGSAYTWLREVVNPMVGTWVGLMVVATYFFAVILQPILFGLFFNELLSSIQVHTGYGTWMLGVLLSTLFVAAMSYPGIKVSAKGSVILTVLELVVVLALGCTLLVTLGLRGRLSYVPFDPFMSLDGASGFSRGLVFGLLSFVGLGVITTAAEETRSPRSIIPKVVVLACVFLGLFLAFTSWGFCLAMSANSWSQYMSRGINPVAVIARQYWSGGAFVVIVTAITAVLGVYLASVIGYSRVAFAMGRDRTLPAFLGILHPKYRVPWNAQHVVLLVAPITAGLWGHWLGLYLSYNWWGNAVVFFSMITNIFVNIGCAIYFFRFQRNTFNVFWHATVPLLGVITSIIPLYYSFGVGLWRTGWKGGQSVILFCLFVVVAAALYTVGLSMINPDVLQNTHGR